MKILILMLQVFQLTASTIPLYGQLAGTCKKGNCITGNGYLVTNAGDEYEGNFLAGKRHGSGKFKYSTGGIYEGMWKNDKREGAGRYTFKNGSIFTGVFVADSGAGKLSALPLKDLAGKLSAANIFTKENTAFNNLIRNLKKSVAKIEFGGASGTGFVLADKFIATNIHVAEIILQHQQRQIIDTFLETSTPYRANFTMFDKVLSNIPISVVFKHLTIDLAIIKIDSNFTFPYPAVELLTTNPPVNSTVFAIGGTGMSVKEGKIQAIYNGKLTARDGFSSSGQIIFSDALVVPGDSGSPLFNELGKVASIICWGLENEPGTFSFTMTGAIRNEVLAVIQR